MSVPPFDFRRFLEGFDVPADDPLAKEHQLLADLVDEHSDQKYFHQYDRKALAASTTGNAILEFDREEQTRIAEALVQQIIRLDQFALKVGEDLTESDRVKWWDAAWRFEELLNRVLGILLRKQLPFNSSQLETLTLIILAEDEHYSGDFPISGIVKNIEAYLAETSPSHSLQQKLERLITLFSGEDSSSELRRYADRLREAMGAGPNLPIVSGEPWADQALDDLPANDTDWSEFLTHCMQATASKPTRKWLKTAGELIDRIGWENVREHLIRWFPLVNKPRTNLIEDGGLWDTNQVIIAPHADLLKGLAWCCVGRGDVDIVRVLGALALATYKKVPGLGPREVKVGNAAVYALGEIGNLDAVAQLAILKVRVKYRSAQKGIEKALVSTAGKVGIAPDELEEMSVPAYGLTEPGLRVEMLGEHKAELRLDGGKPKLHWFKADGKEQKSVPSAVKKDYQEDLKELKQAVKDIEKMLPAQSARIEQCYLAQKDWTFPVWCERYHEHPLMATLSRRLIWQFQAADQSTAAIWSSDRFVDCGNEPVDWISDSTTVSLWHPLFELETEAITAWRDWLVKHEVRQPFKQAHREVYLLTDAERNTRVYSNRFAAHILKQHQFNALCAARNWRNSLRLMVDDSAPPAHLLLPNWDLRAEFWIEGAGHDYGVDTNESGTFLYLVTDQVRFYRTDAAENQAHVGGGGYQSTGTDEEQNRPVPVENIPALAFSEVMRDVDLFVGVSSVGNDPNWHDGGPEGRYFDYWQEYSFGELGNSARTRKKVLEKLIPRLKIATKCSFQDRFLFVKGKIRTYKIHLGSGNILMEPNDQYLCIVPSQTVSKKGDGIFLPFEGDKMLSIILSKAMLLADDTKIKDPTIVSQIKR